MKDDFLLLDLGTLDVVLGMQWLQTMGKMEADWPVLMLKFDKGGKQIMIRGNPILARLEVSMKHPAKQWEAQAQGYLVELQTLNTQMEEAEVIPDSPLPLVENMIHEYLDLFQKPEELPPNRAVDHRIPLKEGQPPVNVRPY